MTHGGSSGSDLPDLPDWVFKFRSLEDIRNWVIGIIVTSIVAGILALWDAVLWGVSSFWSTIAWAWTMIGDAGSRAFSPMWWIFDGLDYLSGFITDAAMSAGVFAPLVAVLAWGSVMILVALLLNFVLNLLSTYLPLRGLPLVGRFFR